MPYGMLRWVDSRNQVLHGVQIPHGKGRCWGGRTCLMTLWRELCKNGWTDRDAVWVMDSGGPKEACIRWGCRSPCKGAILRGNDVAGMPNDILPWAVHKWLNRSRCLLGCGLKEPCVRCSHTIRCCKVSRWRLSVADCYNSCYCSIAAAAAAEVVLTVCCIDSNT